MRRQDMDRQDLRARRTIEDDELGSFFSDSEDEEDDDDDDSSVGGSGGGGGGGRGAPRNRAVLDRPRAIRRRN
jgi:hypothetical protein